jgi:hypothetical protein
LDAVFNQHLDLIDELCAELIVRAFIFELIRQNNKLGGRLPDESSAVAEGGFGRFDGLCGIKLGFGINLMRFLVQMTINSAYLFGVEMCDYLPAEDRDAFVDLL